MGLMCTLVTVAASTAPVTGMSQSAARPVSAVTATVADEVPFLSPVVTSMCVSACVGGTTGVVCTGAAGLVVTSVLILLMAFRRTTYLGLLARLRRAGLARRRLRERTHWLVLSPISLCVFRV